MGAMILSRSLAITRQQAGHPFEFHPDEPRRGEVALTRPSLKLI
jgi:hypothetical protein